MGTLNDVDAYARYEAGAMLNTLHAEGAAQGPDARGRSFKSHFLRAERLKLHMDTAQTERKHRAMPANCRRAFGPLSCALVE